MSSPPPRTTAQSSPTPQSPPSTNRIAPSAQQHAAHHLHGRVQPSTPPVSAASLTLPTPPTRKRRRSDPQRGCDDEHDAHDSYAMYMQRKTSKLRAQFSQQFNAPRSTLFSGVVVWVDGHTQPSRLHIRRIMGAHAGRLETYFTSRVTHVVATHLATATRLALNKRQSSRRPVAVVHPQWISQCLHNGRRLPEPDFPVPGMTDPSQRSLKSFFSPKKTK